MTSQRGLSRVLLAVLGLAGCSGQSEIITPPPPPPTGFTIEFRADDDDLTTAQALGWANGIPEVDLTLTPTGGTGGPRTYRGSAGGTLSITDLPTGKYTALGTRWLAANERSQLSTMDDALGFVSRTDMDVVMGGRRALRLQASRIKTLVISEWAFNPGPYSFGGFLELHNNADTTIYLDGMILAEGFNRDYDYPVAGCAETEPYRNDPEGIWSRLLQRFPGAGRDYPLPPGGRVVVATDAIDHRPLVQDGIDLSQADFEFSGPADVNNPAVPDMVESSTRPHLQGHGLLFLGLGTVTVVAQAADPGTFVRQPIGGSEALEYVRIPPEVILDVLWIRSNFAAPTYPECPRLVHARFDRAGSDVRSTDDVVEYVHSVSRIAVPSTVLGRFILQHTRSGKNDFTRTTRTPSVP